MVIDITALADEVKQSYANKRVLPAPFSAREPAFDLDTAYAIQAELTRQRRAAGRSTVGRKVGFANKAIWRALKLETLVWAHMYDDTVVQADATTSLPIDRMCSPKIEPEVVFRLREPIDIATSSDPAAVLASVEWLALGFEIVDSIFADWKFQPADFVAAYGLHAALVVGEPMAVGATNIPMLVDQLAQFKLHLTKNGQVIAEGSGRNSLRSPALCLGELAGAILKRQPHEPLAAAELVSSGSLTDAQFIAAGETWSATVDGIGLSTLTLTLG